MDSFVDTLYGALDAACRADDAVVNALDVDRVTYALFSAVITGALAWGFLATWLFAFGRLRRAGLARRQQRLVWWFAAVAALLQVFLTLREGIGIAPVDLPVEERDHSGRGVLALDGLRLARGGREQGHAFEVHKRLSAAALGS